LKNFRANFVFRASAGCSKILNDKKYFNTVKHFGASASCSKILNDEKYFNTVKISGETLFLRATQVAQKSGMIKNISIQ